MKQFYVQIKKTLTLLPIMLVACTLYVQAQSPLTVSGVPTDGDCPGNGVITATASGGNAPYQYRIATGPNASSAIWQNSPVLGSLQPGTYTIQVREANNNSITATSGNIAVATTYTAMNIPNASHTNVQVGNCFQANVTVTKTGTGKAPFTYTLLQSGNPVYGPQSSNVFLNVATGVYDAQVMDACGEVRTRTGVPVTKTDYKWQTSGDQARIIAYLPFPSNLYAGAPLDTTTLVRDVYPIMFTCDSITFRLNYAKLTHNLQLSGTAPLTMQRNVKIIDLVTNDTVFNLTYKPEDYASYGPTVRIRHNRMYRYVFDDLCDDVYSMDQSWVYNGSNNLQIRYGREDCSGIYMTFSWGAPGQPIYHSAVDTFEIINSTAPGDTLVGKKIYYNYVNNSLSTERIYGVTLGASYTVRISNVCTTYTRTATATVAGTSIVINPTSHMCQKNTTALYFRYNNLVPVPGTIKYEIHSGPTSFTDTFGNPYTITYPIKDSFEYTGSGTPQLYSRNYPRGIYNITFTDNCGVQINRNFEVLESHLLKLEGTLDFDITCTSNINLYFEPSIMQQVTREASTAPFVNVEKYDGTNWVLVARNGFTPSNWPQEGTRYRRAVTNGAGLYRVTFEGRTGDYFNGPVEDCDPYYFRDSIEVRPYQVPVILPSSMGFVCNPTANDGTATIHGSEGIRPYTYQMIDAVNNVLVSQTDSVFTGLSRGVHRFRILDVCGNGVVQQLSIDTLEDPVFASGGTTYCIGTDAFVTSPRLFEGATYAWSGPNSFTSTNDTLFFTPITANDTGTYTLVQTIPGCAKPHESWFRLTNCFIALPLHLISFEAKLVNNATQLHWVTAKEENVSHFEIERSSNGNVWTKVGSIKSKSESGNSGEQLHYHFTDKYPTAGRNLYRLKQVSFEGANDYSPVRTVWLGTEAQISIHPNPTTGTVNITGLNGNESIVVYDVTSRKIATQKATTSSVSIDLSNYADGVYSVTIISEDGTQTYKIVKK